MNAQRWPKRPGVHEDQQTFWPDEERGRNVPKDLYSVVGCAEGIIHPDVLQSRRRPHERCYMRIILRDDVKDLPPDTPATHAIVYQSEIRAGRWRRVFLQRVEQIA